MIRCLQRQGVSAVLQASITGAGLIIAIYALITPIARKIFEERRNLLLKKKKEFDELKGKLSEESSETDFKKLKILSTEIREIRMYPRYLGFGVFVVFFLYITTACTALGWLVNPLIEDVGRDLPVICLFLISTFGFLFVGIYAIIDVHRTMKKEFEETN